MKKFELLFLMFLLTTTQVFSASIGGERPDMTPSWISFTKLENHIIKKAELLRKTIAEMKSASPKEGWFTESPRKKLEDKVAKESDELKNYLATKPTNYESAMEKIQIKNNDDMNEDAKRSNNEVIELNYTSVNIRHVLASFQERMQKDPQNLETAIKYYEVYITCLDQAIDMHSEFIRNVDGKYRQLLNKHINKMNNHLVLLQKEIIGIKEQENIDTMNSNIHNTEICLNDLKAACLKLTEQKQWALTNKPKLQEKRNTVQSTLETAKLTKQASDIIKAINKDFNELKFDLPPLINFEYNPSTK